MSDIVEAARARMDAPTPPPLTGPTIKVKVLFFASAREMAGCDRYVAELPVGARTSTLRAHLKDKFLLLGEGALDTPMAINEAYVPYDEDPELSDLDDVALIPPISGG